MKRVLFFITINFLWFYHLSAQKLSLHGKLGDSDFVLVEKTINDIFSRSSSISIQVLYGKSEMVKVDRNIGIDVATLKSYYSSIESFAEEIDCETAQKVISTNQNSSTYRSFIGYLAYPCKGESNSNYSVFINSVVTQINSRIRPEIGLFFNRTMPEITLNEKIRPNSTLTDRKISGTCNSLVGGKIIVLEDGKTTSQIPISEQWETNLKSSSNIKSLKIFAVNEKGDSSNLFSFSNITLKMFDATSLSMFHPGGISNTKGIPSDVVLKCNTMSLNGFYNFQFLVDRQMNLDSVVLMFEDIGGGRVMKKKFLYNVDQSLVSVNSLDENFNKVCLYLVYSEFGFKTPCDIDDSFVYYLSYRLPDGQKIETSKKRIYFESFRENYDETPCLCN